MRKPVPGAFVTRVIMKRALRWRHASRLSVALSFLVFLAAIELAQTYTAKLGVLFRLVGTNGGDLGSTWYSIALSAELAVRHINNRTSSVVPQAGSLLDPDFQVEYLALDTRSQPSIGVANAFAFLNEDVDAIIGSYRSAVNAPVALVSETENVPVVAFGATSADLSDKDVYPTFSRTCPSDSMVAFSIIQVCKAMEWQRVGMLYFDDAYGRAFAQDIDTAAGEASIDVVASQRFSAAESSIQHALEVLRQAQVLVAAEAAGMTGSGFVWLSGDAMGPPESVLSLTPEKADRLRPLLAGWLKFVSLPLAPASYYGAVFDAEEASLSHPLVDRGAASLAGSCDVYCAYMYDAVWAASIAVSRARQRRGGAATGDEVTEAVRGLSFEGATGRVSFDNHTGDRGMEGIKVEVLNFVPEAPNRLGQQRLYQWDAASSLGRVNGSSPPTWPGGRVGWDPPSDGRCEGGSVFSGAALQCVPCPAGTAQVGEACEACGEGSIAPLEGMQACAPCQDGYAPTTGATACLDCPAGSSRALGSLGVLEEECLCVLTYFREHGRAVGPCLECPERAKCEGNASTPYPDADTWGDPANPVEFFECKSKRCKGMEGFECERGFGGIMCEGTEAGWFSFGSGVRWQCPSGRTEQVLMHTALILAVLLTFFTLNRLLASRYDSIDLFLDSMQRLAIVANFRLRWPEQFAELFTLLEIVLLDADLARPDCVMSWNFSYSFWVQKLLLLGIFALIWVPVVWSSWQMRVRKGVPWRQVLLEEEHNSAAVNQGVKYSLDTLLMMYPTLAKNTLDTFTCRNFGGADSFLVADPNFKCGTTGHTTVMVVSALLQPLLIFALPLGTLAGLVLATRHHTLHRQKHLDRFGVLYARYEPPYLWWEGWRTIQKLLLVGIQVLLWQYPLLQGMMALLLFLLSLASHYYAQPYASEVLDGMDSASYFVSCLFTMVGISFYSTDFSWRTGLYILTLAGLAVYAVVAVWCAYLNVRERVASEKAAGKVRAAARKHGVKLHKEADRRAPEEQCHVRLQRAETAASLKQLMEETDEGLSELPSTLDGHVFKRWTDSEEVSIAAYHKLKKVDAWLAPYVSDQSPTSQFSLLPDAEFFRQVNVFFPNFFSWVRKAPQSDMLDLRRLFRSILDNAEAPDEGFKAAIVPGDQSSVLYWLINIADEEERESLFSVLQLLINAQPIGRVSTSASDSSWFATNRFLSRSFYSRKVASSTAPASGSSKSLPCSNFASTAHPHSDHVDPFPAAAAGGEEGPGSGMDAAGLPQEGASERRGNGAGRDRRSLMLSDGADDGGREGDGGDASASTAAGGAGQALREDGGAGEGGGSVPQGMELAGRADQELELLHAQPLHP